jgi:hypothetical protein
MSSCGMGKVARRRIVSGQRRRAICPRGEAELGAYDRVIHAFDHNIILSRIADSHDMERVVFHVGAFAAWGAGGRLMSRATSERLATNCSQAFVAI